MKLQLLAILALALAAYAADADDPTTVCLPSQFQSTVYDFNNRDLGVAAGDFTKNLTVLTFQKANFRLLYDLTALKTYLIVNDTCTNFDMDPSQAIFRCLPATAVPLTTNVTRIGLESNGLPILSYAVPISNDIAIRVAVTDSVPAYPVLRQLIGTAGRYTGNVLLFLNTVLNIDPQLFVFPLIELGRNHTLVCDGLEQWIGAVDWSRGLKQGIEAVDWSSGLEQGIGAGDWSSGLEQWIEAVK
nr:Ovipostatin 4 [Biomphalaria glabrata]